MGIEGSLNIQLHMGNGAVVAVSTESSRPVHASRVFIGKSIAEAQRMIPLLFNICGTAQACACARACEQALGVQAGTGTEQVRDALVNMETIREHLWRILLDWPSFTAGQADEQAMVEMVAIQRDYRRGLCMDGDIFQTGGSDCEPGPAGLSDVLERLTALLERSVFGIAPDEWLALSGQQALVDWAGDRQTMAARLADQVIQAGWGHAGRCESDALPGLGEELLHQAMRDADYVKQPQWSGHCCETTSLTRCDSPVLQDLKQVYGNGLLARLVARLTEIALLATRLKTQVLHSQRELVAETKPASAGIGQVAAARGQLVHRVKLNAGSISDYQILAPTEWNFHPQGVVVASLASLRGDPAQVEQQARLLVNAIDPCVAYDLQIHA